MGCVMKVNSAVAITSKTSPFDNVASDVDPFVQLLFGAS